MIRFALIGSGWRGQFFMRAAKYLPEEFCLTAVMVRDPEKGKAFGAQHGVRVVNSLDDLLKDAPEFVIVSVRREFAEDYLLELCRRGVPVLCETPPVYKQEKLVPFWQQVRALDGDIQVAEQYMWQPLYASWDRVIREGMLGRVENISLSALHGYHAANVIRHWLGADFCGCTIYGKKYPFEVTKTGGREGFCYTGETVTGVRDRLTFEFDNGTVAFFDFDGTQYHSSIRTRQLNVQGTRGEIDDLTVRYLTEENIPVTQTLRRIDQGVWNNQDWAHYGVMLGDRYLYRSPFPTARLNDDELAVASCMRAMHEHLTNGTACYSLKEAMQDTWLSLKMDEALAQPLTPVRAEIMPWAEA